MFCADCTSFRYQGRIRMCRKCFQYAMEYEKASGKMAQQKRDEYDTRSMMSTTRPSSSALPPAAQASEASSSLITPQRRHLVQFESSARVGGEGQSLLLHQVDTELSRLRETHIPATHPPINTETTTSAVDVASEPSYKRSFGLGVVLLSVVVLAAAAYLSRKSSLSQTVLSQDAIKTRGTEILSHIVPYSGALLMLLLLSIPAWLFALYMWLWPAHTFARQIRVFYLTAVVRFDAFIDCLCIV